MRSRIHYAAIAALVALGVSAPLAKAKQIRLQAAAAEPVMLAGQKKVTYVKVGLTGFKFAPEEADRAPVNVAIVLDKSGSMKGNKMARAKDAAKMAIDRLGKDDIVSVVTYDSTVRVVVPATKVSDKEDIFRMIDEIQPAGNTALFAGVSKGAAELRKFSEKEYVNRVILVSDGIANVGPSTPGALGELGVSLRKEGISVSTVGLGSDYNEDLMFALAERSDGNHSFAESGKQLAAIFDGEFGDVLSVVAQEVLVRIDCMPGVRPVRVLGREAEISGQACTVLLNQLYSEQEKYVLLEVEVPPAGAGEKRDLANVAVSYANMATKVTDVLTTKLAVRFSAAPGEVLAACDKDVMVASVMQIATLENLKAMRQRDEGNIAKAKQTLAANWAFCLENADLWGSKELADYGTNNGIDSERLEGQAWLATRKAMRADQFKNTQQVQSRGFNDRGDEIYSQGTADQAELQKYLDASETQKAQIDKAQVVPRATNK